MTAACDFAALRQRCVEELDAAGQFADPWVRAAFEAVPRETFVPSQVWISDKGDGGGYPLIDRDTDPELWARTVYTHDRALVTQMDDGATARVAGAAGRFSSSLSMPRVVARQLSWLDLRPGRRVLHIGTGSGYDSALIAERVGARNIVSVEMDPAVAAEARHALDAAGYGGVRTAVGDGERGWPDGAPYDRVLSTASAQHVPWAWVSQTAPGGLIVTPYRGLALLRLTVAEDGKSASGRVVDAMSFMTLRGQRGAELVGISPVVDATMPESEQVRVDTDLSVLEGELGAEFLFHLLTPEVAVAFGRTTWWFQARDGSAWAAWKKDGRGRQWGPRRLLDEAAAAVTAWREAGTPRFTDLGVMVRADGESVWVDGGGSWPIA
ncbi:methyltransferase domain-containing protein [Streptomyces sp. NPDC002537]